MPREPYPSLNDARLILPDTPNGVSYDPLDVDECARKAQMILDIAVRFGLPEPDFNALRRDLSAVPSGDTFTYTPEPEATPPEPVESGTVALDGTREVRSTF